MIVDTSAVVAILLLEPPHERMLACLDGAESRLMSAGSMIELQIVASRRRGPTGRDQIVRLISELEISVVSVTPAQALAAGEAFTRFGPGSGSKARLNFGDCFAYALAAETGEPLLFVGDDFTHTDITPALPA